MKTPLLKSNLFIKPSIVLGAAVLTAAFLLAPFAWADDGDPPMPPGTTFDPNPAAPNSPTNQVLVYGTDKDGTAVPMKTLRITNNTPNTVYPIMRDQNATILADKAVGLYDPYDTPKREYRGYIGYQGTDEKYYFGLKGNETILVNIPLVFWDAARMGVETGGGGQYLLNNETKLPNPLRNDSKAARTIAKSEAGPGAINNGVVMWYRSDTPTLAVAPLTIPRINSSSGRFATTATWSIRKSRKRPSAQMRPSAQLARVKFPTINWSH